MNELRNILRIEIHATADELRALKRWLRTPPDARPEAPTTSAKLYPLRWRATLLCMLVAHSRGRIHQRATASLEEQAAALVEALDAMDRMKYQTPVLDVRIRAAARAILARGQPVRPVDACVALIVERRV
jgi:hypothetical protein